jgi:SAM-dependent methyltransferase
MTETQVFDPIWEQLYGEGKYLNRYPFDAVVSFIFRFRPREKSRHDITILEVGCGAGNNLWFAAREGFQVIGIDGSFQALLYAQQRFAEDDLEGQFAVADFTRLPFEAKVFDLVIDRGALTCCGKAAVQQAVTEVWRVLKANGHFLCNPYSDRHSSYVAGTPKSDGLMADITVGTLVGVGKIGFYGRQDIHRLFARAWKLLSIQHVETTDMLQPQYTVHAEWRIIAQKSLV